ncbi:hypothetical protein [Streptomyces sp. NPDC004230]
MIRFKGLVPCDGATVELDPWVPLKISWHVARDAQPLYLLVGGMPLGYLELKVHPESGSLMSLTVIELPVEAACEGAKAVRDVADSHVPVLDVSLWSESNSVATERRIVKLQTEMKYARTRGEFCIDFSDSLSPRSRIECGPVAIEISENGEMSRLVAKVA